MPVNPPKFPRKAQLIERVVAVVGRAMRDFRLEFSNMTWLAADRLFRVLGTLAITILAARVMGPSDFGRVSYALTLIGFLTIIVTLGLGSVVVRAIVNRPAEAKLTLGTAFILQIVASALVFTCIAGWALLSGERGNGYGELVLIMAAGLIFRPTDVIRYWFESQVQSKYSVIADNLAFLIGAAAKLLALYHCRNVEAFAWAIAAEQLFGGACLIIAYRYYRAKPGCWGTDKTMAWSLLRAAWPLLLSGAAVALYMRIDQVMIMTLRGAAETGVYAAATRLSEIFYVIPTIFAATIFPRMQRMLNKSNERYVEVMGNIMTIMVTICTIVSLCVLFFARPAIDSIYGPSYAMASTVLAVHIWTCIFVSLGIMGNQWYLSHGLQSKTLLFTLLGAATNLSMNVVLVPGQGAVGAAISSLCAQIISCFLADAISRSTRQVFFLKLKALAWPIAFGWWLVKR